MRHLLIALLLLSGHEAYATTPSGGEGWAGFDLAEVAATSISNGIRDGDVRLTIDDER